jgi:hypothetical protein
MKKFLFVLLLLGIAVPASADVLVYSLKAGNAGYRYNLDSKTWGVIKDANTAFVIFAPPGQSSDSIDVVAVYTWKGKDKQNYVMRESWGTLGFDYATVSSTKAKWVISAAANGRRIVLNGDVKPTKIASCGKCHTPNEITGFTQDEIKPNLAAALTGYTIEDKTDAHGDRDLCTTSMSLKLNTKETAKTHPDVATAEDAANDIISNLEGAGYINVTEP